MKIRDERETQKRTKNTEKSKGNRSYGGRAGAKWFCCAFKLAF